MNYFEDLAKYEKTFITKVSKITNIPIADIEYDGDDGEEISLWCERETPGTHYWHNRTQILAFSLDEFPNCCGIAVLQGISISNLYRNKGLEKLIHDFALEHAKDRRYGMVILANTTDADNIKALRGSKWNKLKSFINPKTKNRLVAAYRTIGR